MQNVLTAFQYNADISNKFLKMVQFKEKYLYRLKNFGED